MKLFTNPTSSCGKVLIVDDDRRLLAALSLRLQEIGCRCVGCTSSSEAMIAFHNGGFDLVVTDMTMPGMDGMGVVGLIRNQSEIPIIVVTGHADWFERQLAPFANVKLFRKPFDTETLVAAVQAALANGRRNRGSSNLCARDQGRRAEG